MFFPVRDVERLIFELLDPTTLGNLAQVNHYCSIKVQETTWRQDIRRMIHNPVKLTYGYRRLPLRWENLSKIQLFETACAQSNFRVMHACLSFPSVERLYYNYYYFVRKTYREINESVYQWLVIYVLHPGCLGYLIDQIKRRGLAEALKWTEQYYTSLSK